MFIIYSTDGHFVNYGCNSKESLILPPGAMANKHIKINGFSIKQYISIYYSFV